MKLCPSPANLPKWRRRGAMIVLLPLALLDWNVRFFMDAYKCWFRERYFGW